MPADPFGADPFASPPPNPPATGQRGPTGDAAALGRGPVTGRSAGSDMLPKKDGPPIKEIAGGLILLLFLGVIGIGLFPRIMGGFSNLPAINDFDLGTCFIVDGPGLFSKTGCDSPHDGEVVGVGRWNQSADYPGADVLEAWASALCAEQFTTFVGRDPEGSDLYLGVLYPSEVSWGEDDRQAVCAVQFLQTPETGSVAGTRR